MRSSTMRPSFIARSRRHPEATSGIVSGDDEGLSELLVEGTKEVDQLRCVGRIELAGGLVRQEQGGLAASARATATRWRSPPQSSAGRWSRRWANPTRSSHPVAAVNACERLMPRYLRGTATFSAAVKVGRRWWC